MQDAIESRQFPDTEIEDRTRSSDAKQRQIPGQAPELVSGRSYIPSDTLHQSRPSGHSKSDRE